MIRLPHRLLNLLTLLRFPGSSRYWDLRYRTGGNSGAGSYGAEADYKRDYLNACFARREVDTIIDFGCGDGNQLHGLSAKHYLGFDVSPAAVAHCKAMFAGDATKEFRLTEDYRGEVADAVLSLDVLYHLVEYEVFLSYVDRLFRAARRWVIIYAADRDDQRSLRGKHVHRRRFTRLISERFADFRLVDSPPRPAHLPEPDGASFFLYERVR